jgi:hypothetical protein
VAPLTSIAAAFGTLLIADSIAATLRSYGRLPDRIPLHFAADGTVDGYGPRPLVWTTVGMQLGCALLFLWVIDLFVTQSLPARAIAAMAGFGDLMLLLLWRAQRLIIETALSGQNRVRLRSFWLFFGATMLGAIALVTIVAR